MRTLNIAVDGMHCRSCELTLEQKFKDVPGVASVDADAARGSVRIDCSGEPPSDKTIRKALDEAGYSLKGVEAAPERKRPSIGELLLLFGAVLLLGRVVSNLGLLQSGMIFDYRSTFGSIFLVGLIAASTSCMAVTGGLLLSVMSRWNGPSRTIPVVSFVAGRVVSYALFGGLIGAIGKALLPSPAVLGALTVLAALFMLVAGLEMLNLAPAWLKAILPRMPKGIARRVLGARGDEHPLMPFLLGGATFFIPCGFTQSLQIFALTTGSFTAGASVLLAFALGTAPALLALGWASRSLKGNAAGWFFKFSGALVVVLGLWNVQNGLSMAGYRLQLPETAIAAEGIDDPNVRIVDGTQVIRMKLSSTPAYLPSDTYTVKAGVPVRMEVQGIGTGCRGVLQIPKLGVRKALDKQLNVIEFTPKSSGRFVFSCAMGMFPGVLNVEKSS